MKVIDLLNKIAKGEEVPKKIKFKEDILKYDKEIQEYMGISKTGNGAFFDYLFVNFPTRTFINDGVEIIEEYKEIEKLKPVIEFKNIGWGTRIQEEIERYPDNKELMRKINELIDEINKMKEGKE